jgi:hypothetical protein
MFLFFCCLRVERMILYDGITDFCICFVRQNVFWPLKCQADHFFDFFLCDFCYWNLLLSDYLFAFVYRLLFQDLRTVGKGIDQNVSSNEPVRITTRRLSTNWPNIQHLRQDFWFAKTNINFIWLLYNSIFPFSRSSHNHTHSAWQTSCIHNSCCGSW